LAFLKVLGINILQMSNLEEEVFLGSRYPIVTHDFDRAELAWRVKQANLVLNEGRRQDHNL